MAKVKKARTKKQAPRTRARGKRTAAAKRQAVSWLPKSYPAMCPSAILEDCARAIDWYKQVLGGRQRLRLDMPGGMVGHCEIGFGDAVLMLGSPMPPQFPTSTARLGLYVKNCDAVYKKAVDAGARSVQEPADQFYGDRTARFVDPFGNEWTLMTHIRDVSAREMKKVMAQMAGAGGGA